MIESNKDAITITVNLKMIMANIGNYMDKQQFKYWLRINGFRPKQFGTGTKWNPIRLISRKK
jgi:hypothetical protein